MRPRPDAAENARLLAEHKAALEASMRPRPDAAENLYFVGWDERVAAVLQ